MRLEGKVAVITGAGPGNGIGRAIALAFSKEGAKLSLNYLEGNNNDKATFYAELKDYETSVCVVEGDISKEDTAKELIETTLEKYGRIDILVNNAGISTPALLKDMTVSNWDRMIEVNLRSVFLTTRFALPSMISQRFGRIINISSQVAQKGSIEHCHYAAAKAGIIGFTKSLAMEVGEYGITANCIAPGPIMTQLMNEVSDNWRSKKMKELVIPRFGNPDEVAPTAVFLASSPDGNLYTGQTLGPNCGDVML
ncbi:3-oxoacyl-ACP reductase FabG [Bacillus sp. Gen3]|uniref:SDR family NAD(P)-dependent oxidoreductase n=1 Tax=Heyndrickxia TaxID=2837504 RepID=UPI0015D318F7|nr:3-oxoacyl-ACP reductase FabG [Bacillus sp. Gen3]